MRRIEFGGKLIMTRILSGIQPSGELHLGNYFGAILQYLNLQETLGPKDEAFYFIADWHALTTVHDRNKLEQGIRQAAATYISLGLATKRGRIDEEGGVFLFRQSHIPETQELAWLLQCVTGMGLLNRAPAYKDKIAQGIPSNVGLFTYPILMAADILGCQATLVPVGKDQLPHIEIAQDVAQHFNTRFKVDLLLRPEAPPEAHSPVVPGTDGQKMSKSYNNTIPIFSEGKRLKKLVGSIATDSKKPGEDVFTPETCTVFALYSLFASDTEKEALANRYRQDKTFKGYGEAKQLLIEKIDQRFSAARERYKELMVPDNTEIDRILQHGMVKARLAVQHTVELCREAVGLGRRMMIL